MKKRYRIIALFVIVLLGAITFVISDDQSIYRANDIDSAVFDVIVPKDGDYRVTVSAKHASGFIMIYAHEKKE